MLISPTYQILHENSYHNFSFDDFQMVLDERKVKSFSFFLVAIYFFDEHKISI